MSDDRQLATTPRRVTATPDDVLQTTRDILGGVGRRSKTDEMMRIALDRVIRGETVTFVSPFGSTTLMPDGSMHHEDH